MSKHDYITQIEHKIDAHRQTIEALHREIDKLEGAAEVIRQLRGNDGVAMALDVTPQKTVGATYTIRKAIAAPKPGMQKGKTIDRQAVKTTRERIMALLKADPTPMTTTVINERLGHSSKQEYQRVWTVMSDWKKQGIAEKDDVGRFTLKRTGAQPTTEVREDHVATG